MRKLVLSFVLLFGSLYVNSQSMCGGSSATIVPTSTLTNPTYILNPGNFSPNTNGVFVVSPSVTTTYSLLATGSNGSTTVTNTTPVTVTVNPQPNASPTMTQATCTNSNNAMNLNLTFSPASPVPSYTIAWSTIPNGILSPTQYSTAMPGFVTPGPYTATITAAGGCSLITNFTMLPQPAPAQFTVIPFGSTHSITCITPTVQLVANNANLTYTWSGSSFANVENDTILLDATKLGSITCTGLNPSSGCTTTYTFYLVQNITAPTSTISTNLIAINCTQTLVPTVTITATPSVNVSNCVYAPANGGTFCATSYSTIYTPGIPGVYTVNTISDESGCNTIKTFTVTSSDNYPTFNVTSPESFTLGCSTKSVATVKIENAQTTPTPGGAVSYTLLPPSYTLAYGTGTASTYTVNTPGQWTVVVKDNANNCQTKSVISIIQNTFTPLISANVPRQILDCSYSVTVLEGLSETPNVSYNWGFVGTPGNVSGSTISVIVDLSKNTQTLINTYTLTITDNGNTCKSFSVIPMNQNIFPPKTAISNGGVNALTCTNGTIVLTNQSTTGIPASSGYPTTEVIQAFIWYGPTPQLPLQLSSTYTAQTIGTYTLIARDLNNFCTAPGTITILDNKNYPQITNGAALAPPTIIDCGANSVTLKPAVTPSTGLSYSWTAPSATSTTSDKSKSSLDVKYPGEYHVIVTNTLNGCATLDSMVAVNGTLTANFKAEKKSGYAPFTATFLNTSTSLDTNGIKSYWNFSNGTTSNYPGAVNVTALYTQPGTYTITLYAIKGSCSDTAYDVINVEVPSSLTVPNVFTPNGDGVNDLFFLKASHLTDITFVVYDRWGHITFELTGVSGNIEWDGKNQYGKESAEGVYFYYIKAKGTDGTDYDQKGTINLIR